MRYACQTYFDITVTGVTGHYKPANLPFCDNSGQTIKDFASWSRARNQQRNWETLTQVISMRTQVFELMNPQVHQGLWTFEFEVETADAFGPPENPVSILLTDADGVPMINSLNNTRELVPILQTQGPNQNIWFAPISINKT